MQEDLNSLSVKQLIKTVCKRKGSGLTISMLFMMENH